MRPTRAEAIRKVLTAKARPDLAAMYSDEMEVQVLVAKDGGSREGEYGGWQQCSYTDGAQTWYPFRVPKNAGTEPEDNSNLPMTYDLAAHAEGIGMTGWNWKQRRSRWVAFDFDAITGHSDKHRKKLDDIELNQVRDAASGIPWVTTRRSSSGKGLHLYVFVDVETANHHEHAALGRALLGQMSALAGFDFVNIADVCGGNMWVWHRKQTEENHGFELLKEGRPLAPEEVPVNWRDHLKVTMGRARRSVPSFVNEKEISLFEQMTGQRQKIKLDEEHRKLIDWLRDNGAFWSWESDQHILITHTVHLQEAHSELNLRGVFKTVALGTEKGADQNCWLSPTRRGGWVVRRYSLGCAEDATWTQDESGYTMCYLNREPDLRTAARHMGGIELEKGGFQFTEASEAVKAAEKLGSRVEALPPAISLRPAILKQHKDGYRLVMEVDHDPRDHSDGMKGWIVEKGKWKRVVNTSTGNNEVEVASHDDNVRHVISEQGDDAGWLVKADTGWNAEPLGHIKAAMKTLGVPAKEVELVVGASVCKPWVLVNRPFEPEYPGDRMWNRRAAQLKLTPAEDEGDFPTWKKIFAHIGKGLDDAIRTNIWARKSSIKTGAEYLMLWVASLIKHPLDPLPYLFFYGPQNCGKSIFHEALEEFIISRGVCRAGSALKGGGFNAELEGTVLCVVEEIDIAGTDPKGTYNRLKDWVTSPTMQIHRKGQTPYDTRNTTHWVQIGNTADVCVVFPNDTRITMTYVDALDPLDLIPKKTLRGLLQREAPYFLKFVLNLELPPSDDRLNLPVIQTEEKAVMGRANRTPLEKFLEERSFHVVGEMVPFGEFYNRFAEILLDETERQVWNRNKVSRELPPHHPTGKPTGSVNVHIGNISWSKPAANQATKRQLISESDKLIPKPVPQNATEG